MRRTAIRILMYAVVLLSAIPPAEAQKASQKKTVPKKSVAAPAKNAKNAKKTAAKPKKSVAAESSAELKKKQNSTQQEIKETKAKIASNEKSVSQGLADLSRIDADIQVTRKQVNELAGQVTALDNQITDLGHKISANEKELKSLRENYLVAVKKMRKAKGKKSSLSFIFSSKNFSQAMRRIRYLREFNNWRERQTIKIQKKNDELKAQNLQLSQAKQSKNVALGKQKEANATLQSQYARQDALIVQLRKQGDQLRAHLAKKQSEANELRNRISAAIAAEQQREAERRKAEERRLAEEKRKAEERRLAEEKRQTEQRRLEAERAEAARKKADTEKQKNSELAAKSGSDKTTKARNRNKNKEEAKKPANQTSIAENSRNKKNDSERSYADARKRTPRGDSQSSSKSNTKTSAGSQTTTSTPSKPTTPSAGGGFEKMRGSLPKPVSGAFRITSPFGRHALPDLPGVTYDNPGIDAEVSAGATAQAVYEGKVTGIYRLPGYNTVVIVSHGNYYTVYGNLATTSVKNGDTVRQGQALGKVANSDEGGRPSIHFEVWKNRDKLNPAEWIR